MRRSEFKRRCRPVPRRAAPLDMSALFCRGWPGRGPTTTRRRAAPTTPECGDSCRGRTRRESCRRISATIPNSTGGCGCSPPRRRLGSAAYSSPAPPASPPTAKSPTASLNSTAPSATRSASPSRRWLSKARPDFHGLCGFAGRSSSTRMRSIMYSLRCLCLVVVFASPLTAARAESPAPAKSLPDLIAAARDLTTSGEWAKAIPLWREVVERNPVDGRYWSALGDALIKEKEYRQAVAALTKAFELRAGYPAATAYNVACCHALLGEKEPALKWLETALKSGFRFLSRAQTDPDLASLRDDPKYRELVLLAHVSK